MTPTVLICSRRDDGDWRDLDICLTTLHHYAGTLPVTVWVSGRDVDWVRDTHPGVEWHTQPATCRTFGAAYAHACDHTPGPWIIANDDIRLRPDTAEMLLDDVASVPRPGFVAARSNYIRPSMIARQPGNTCLPTPAVSPIFAYLSEAALAATRWPDCNWYSDDIVCWDMMRAGFQHWISRAYVDHIGERSTGSDHGQLAADALTWAAKHRPDWHTEYVRAQGVA